MEPEVIGTIGVLSNRSRTAVLKVLGFRNNKINIVGEYHTAEGTIATHSTTCTTSTQMSDSPKYDSLVDKGYTYYAEVVVPAPGRYQVMNASQDVGTTTYSRISRKRPLPIGDSLESGISWNYRGEIVDVQVCTYNVVDARLSASRWAGIKAIVNAHKEKELLHLGQIIEAPSGLNSVTGGSAQFAVFSIDDIPCYPHAVIFGSVQLLMGPRMMTTSKVSTNYHGYYSTDLAITLDTTYFSSLPSELQHVITPRQATYTPGNSVKSYYPETHRVWIPRLSELAMSGKVNVKSGELSQSMSYLELDARLFGLAKYCEYHPNSDTLLNDVESGVRIYYSQNIWTATAWAGKNFAIINAKHEIGNKAPNVSQAKSTDQMYVVPFFMISADDDSCEYHYLRMLT